MFRLHGSLGVFTFQETGAVEVMAGLIIASFAACVRTENIFFSFTEPRASARTVVPSGEKITD